MNVSFIGCPCSGKTTTAAMAFARLKEIGHPAEFVPEYARQYIAHQRLVQGLKPTDKLVLNDADQKTIMCQQSSLETTMSRACGPDVVTISDTWSLSALLYMTPEGRKDPFIRAVIESQVLPFVDLLFYAMPVSQPKSLDPNRIHNDEEALAIDGLILPVLREFAPDINIVMLDGTPSERVGHVMYHIGRRSR